LIKSRKFGYCFDLADLEIIAKKRFVLTLYPSVWVGARSSSVA